MFLTLPEPARFVNLPGAVVAKHPAHHVAVPLVPHVVTHGAPRLLVEHLHPALVRARSVDQSDQRLLRCSEDWAQVGRGGGRLKEDGRGGGRGFRIGQGMR